jgi:hypothetical protein
LGRGHVEKWGEEEGWKDGMDNKGKLERKELKKL